MKFIEVIAKGSEAQQRVLMPLSNFGYMDFSGKHGYINVHTKVGTSIAYQGMDWFMPPEEKESTINEILALYIRLTEEIQAFAANARTSYLLIDLAS